MQPIPSEFAEFVRDTGVRAFDRLSERAAEMAAPLRPVLRAWKKLSSSQKNELFEVLMATLQGGETTLPAKPRKAAKKTASKKKR